MKLFNIISAGTLAAVFATSAFAASDSVINTITQDLVAQGYTKIHVLNAGNTVTVEAYGPSGSLERVYDGAGTVIRTKSDTNERGDSLVGGVIGVDNNTVAGDSGFGDNDNGLADNDGDDDNGLGGRDDDNDHGGRSDNDHGGRSDNDHGGRGDNDHGGSSDNDHGGRDNNDHGGRDDNDHGGRGDNDNDD